MWSMTVRLNAFARRIAWLVCICIVVAPFRSSSWPCAAANATNASDAQVDGVHSTAHASGESDVARAEAARVYDTPMDQVLWLDRHNWFRSEGLLWEAANMRRIQWEFTLAEEARAAIASCEKTPSESPGLHVYIESTPDLPLDVTLMDRAMQSWGFDELYGVIPTLPIPGKGATGSHSKVGVGVYNHYSQLVWSSTNRVGCAYNICGEGRLAACKYAPVGNTPGVAWYEFGEPCSHCDAAEAVACSQNLCVTSNSSASPNSVDAKDSSSTVHLPQKVKALQIALDSYVVHPGDAAATTSVSALSTEATSGVACNFSTPASNVVTQEQLSLLDLGGGVSPLAVIFGLFLGVGAILMMIVCIMHATKPKRRHSEDQYDSGDEQEEQELSESDQESRHVQTV
ncbi:Scp-like extracellular protein, partial [Globisporangium splendens]